MHLKISKATPFRRHGRTLISFCLLGLVMFSGNAHAQDWVYTVKPGDNPWKLSQKYLKNMRDWRRLIERNGIKDATRIPTGTRLRIPIAWLKTEIQPSTVRILDVTGSAQTSIANNGRSQALKTGAVLQAGATIETPDAGNVLLEFNDGSQFRLQENSRLELAQLDVDEQTGFVDARITLPRGRLEGEVTPRTRPNTRFEIRTPAAVTAVRGTEFRISMDADNASRTELITGKVDVSNGTRSTPLEPEFGTVTATGAAPRDPIALLPPPDTATLAANINALQFDWPSLRGAETYRVQLLSKPKKRFTRLRFDDGTLTGSEQGSASTFQVLLLDKTVAESRFASSDNLPNGQYTVRVRGVDNLGLEGLNSEHKFTLFANP